ncbi:MAG: class I SAM-dependent methyltransferase [Chloroflexota bacterium]
MNTYKEDTYGERIADIYDEWYSAYDETAGSFLSELARGGRALELGIGTGRVALPLRQKGVAVHGIDASSAMLTKLRVKPGGADLPVTLGNFADVAVEGQFALIYVLFNTFFALLTQDEQIGCFENVARRLDPEGVFVIEAFVPDPARFSGRQAVSAIKVDDGEVRLDVTQWDPVNQHLTSQHVVLTEQGIKLFPVKLRYAWPSELDLMARLAGLRLRERWSNWARAAFTADSGKHISVYARG